MPWGAAAAAAALVSGAMGASASRSAARTQAGAADRATALQEEMYQTTRGDLAPYRDAGGPALQRLMYLTGIGDRSGFLRDDAAARMGIKKPTMQDAADEYLKGHIERYGSGYTGASDMDVKALGEKQIFERMMSEYNAKTQNLSAGSGVPGGPDDFGSLMRDFTLADFAKDPGYEFRLGEGEKALARAAASRGLLKSTPGLKSLMRFNQDLASTEFGAAYGRDAANKATKFNLLSHLSGIGQNAAAMTGQAGANMAAGGSQAIMAGGNAAAAGVLGSASAWNNAIQGGLGNYMYQKRWDDMMSRFPVFSAPAYTSNTPNSGMYFG